MDAKQIRYSWMIDADGEEHDGVTLQSIIDKVPAADVVEVKHGHWIRKDYKPCGHDYYCSVCGYAVPQEYKHCPECIAKMDGYIF